MYLPAGQVPNQPGVHRTEQKIAGFRQLCRLRNILQYPADFCRGKIRIYRQSCLFAEHIFQPLLLQGIAVRRSPAALPYNRRTNRPAAAFIPKHSRFPLVRNANRRNLRRGNTLLFQHSPRRFQLCLPNLRRIMLHPAGLRIILPEFLLCNRKRLSGTVKQYRPRACRALVKRKNIFHSFPSFFHASVSKKAQATPSV